MTSLVLGIHAGLNASAVVGMDGVVVAAVQEERPTREKNYCGFPARWIELVLKQVSASGAEVDTVVFGTNHPLGAYRRRAEMNRRFDAYFENLNRAESNHENLVAAHPSLNEMLEPVGLGDVPALTFDHHLSHAATTFYGLTEPGADAKVLVVTCDGFGDGLSGSAWWTLHPNGTRAGTDGGGGGRDIARGVLGKFGHRVTRW